MSVWSCSYKYMCAAAAAVAANMCVRECLKIICDVYLLNSTYSYNFLLAMCVVCQSICGGTAHVLALGSFKPCDIFIIIIRTYFRYMLCVIPLGVWPGFSSRRRTQPYGKHRRTHTQNIHFCKVERYFTIHFPPKAFSAYVYVYIEVSEGVCIDTGGI